MQETEITRTIMSSYHDKLLGSVLSDVLVVGAGPAGLVAGFYLTKLGFKVTMVERCLAPGGGIWGGGMAMNEVAFQEEALPVLVDFGIRHERQPEGLYTVDSVELASALILKAIQAGVTLLNLVTLEDIGIHHNRVTGIVVNRTGISGALHVDPLTFSAKAILDATGHEATVIEKVRRRGLFPDSPLYGHAGEGPMDAATAEAFVVERTGEVCPGLWVAGMSVNAAIGGPRMGPIFGGMLLSGKRAAELISATLKQAPQQVSCT
ncbi:MAG: thiazole biosynthesis protein [Phycisphaerae bacterium]|nr:thiazole biosynthesis protein [Phycisphaerae bacterium]